MVYRYVALQSLAAGERFMGLADASSSRERARSSPESRVMLDICKTRSIVGGPNSTAAHVSGSSLRSATVASSQASRLSGSTRSHFLPSRSSSKLNNSLLLLVRVTMLVTELTAPSPMLWRLPAQALADRRLVAIAAKPFRLDSILDATG